MSESIETLLRNGCLNDKSLQACIDSPNFRDYEKAMAREIVKLKAERNAARDALKLFACGECSCDTCFRARRDYARNALGDEWKPAVDEPEPSSFFFSDDDGPHGFALFQQLSERIKERNEMAALLLRWANAAGRAEHEQGFTTPELHHCWTDTMQALKRS